MIEECSLTSAAILPDAMAFLRALTCSMASSTLAWCWASSERLQYTSMGTHVKTHSASFSHI